MSRLLVRLGLALLVTLASGCASGPFKDFPKPYLIGDGGKELLEDGVRDYEDGNYRQAGRKIKTALDDGLRSKTDRVTAHKYLAFINCASNREIQCREEFRQAIDIDPRFDLTGAESGHPVWGPVFRSVKERAP
jgi:Tfp pilus assembly protein PilF